MQSKALLSRLSAAELSGVERNEAERAGRENKNPQKFLGLLGVLVCF